MTDGVGNEWLPDSGLEPYRHDRPEASPGDILKGAVPASAPPSAGRGPYNVTKP